MRTKALCVLLASAATMLPGLAAAEGPYAGLIIGPNFARDQVLSDASGDVGSLGYDFGTLSTVGLGWATMSGFRPELEFAFRSNDVEDEGTTAFAPKGEQHANAGMANLWYDFGSPRFAPKLRPYIGGGFGLVKLDYRHLGGGASNDNSITDTTEAWQAGVGAAYDYSRRIALTFGYRYFEAREGQFGSLQSDHRSDGIAAGVRWSFGRPIWLAKAQPVVDVAQRDTAEAAAFETIVLKPVNFKFDRADFTDPAQQTLDGLAKELAQYPELRVLIEGHTDAIGTDTYNQGLAMRRANAVRDYLAKAGVDPSRLEVQAMGEEIPEETNRTPDGRAANRRAELYPLETPKTVRIRVEDENPATKGAAEDPADPGPGSPGAKAAPQADAAAMEANEPADAGQPAEQPAVATEPEPTPK